MIRTSGPAAGLEGEVGLDSIAATTLSASKRTTGGAAGMGSIAGELGPLLCWAEDIDRVTGLLGGGGVDGGD